MFRRKTQKGIENPLDLAPLASGQIILKVPKR